jgi:hypothetical protein
MTRTAITGTSGMKVMRAASTGTLAKTVAANDSGISRPMNAWRNGMARV